MLGSSIIIERSGTGNLARHPGSPLRAEVQDTPRLHQIKKRTAASAVTIGADKWGRPTKNRQLTEANLTVGVRSRGENAQRRRPLLQPAASWNTGRGCPGSFGSRMKLRQNAPIKNNGQALLFNYSYVY